MKKILSNWITLFLIIGLFPFVATNCNEDDEEVPVVTDIDGNVYHMVTIGTQVWLVENLKTTKFRDGSSIPNVTDAEEWVGHGELQSSAYCNYNNAATNSNTYGRLYNWYAVVDERNICPIGWHIPSEDEWEILITYLGGQDVAGGKMKETGTTHWSSPNTGASNSSGFTGLPGGSRQIITGTFGGLGEGGVWWSKSELSDELAKYYQLYFDQSSIGIGGFGKTSGYSVRCIKD